MAVSNAFVGDPDSIQSWKFVQLFLYLDSLGPVEQKLLKDSNICVIIPTYYNMKMGVC